MEENNTIKIYENPPKGQWEDLCKRNYSSIDYQIIESVKDIINLVKEKTDEGVIECVNKFDSKAINISNIKVSEKEFKECKKLIGKDLKYAINCAIENVKKFHKAQKLENIKVETMPGVFCYQKTVPINSVGLYIPAGTAPLFSTVIMLAVPASLAGCKNITICTPAYANGKVSDVILYTALACGVKNIYKIGGAAAIAAMAYGTQTIPKADKIFGPGNSYVTAAKQMLAYKVCSIDLPAGPSEVLIIADKNANTQFICADFLSQLEHGNNSIAVLVCDNKEIALKVREEFNNQIINLSRRNYVLNSAKNSKIIILSNTNEIVEFTNLFAPEHLIISTKDCNKTAKKITNAGSIFLGDFTPESAGDYASGTNHTLPTCQWACSCSGVNLFSFVKRITLQKITKKGLKNIGGIVQTMAGEEGLTAHKNAVTIRLNNLDYERY